MRCNAAATGAKYRQIHPRHCKTPKKWYSKCESSKDECRFAVFCHAKPKQEKTDDFSKGRAQAYWEVMDMVISRLEILGVQITDDQTKAAV